MSEQNENVVMEDMLFEVAKKERDFILETNCDTKEHIQAVVNFNNCMGHYRDMRKDVDDGYLEQQRINNEIKTNRIAEAQKDRYDKIRLGIEAATVVISAVGLLLSFKVLNEYQEINLNTVVTNKDAVKAADNLFTSMFRRFS